MKYTFSILFLLLLVSLSCRKDRVIREPETPYGDPFQIVSLTEIVNNNSMDRTNEISACRLDDLFYIYGPTEVINLQTGERICEGDEIGSIGGNFRRTETENLDGTLMTIQLSHIYAIHDSLLFGQSELRFTQGYKLIKFTETELTFQNHPNFSTPKTQNIWQLKLVR